MKVLLALLAGTWLASPSTCHTNACSAQAGELRAAVVDGDMKAVHCTLAAGAEVDLPDAEGWTVLHHAARQGRARIAAALLDAGASAALRDSDGMTPLHIAAWYGHAAAAALLVDRGASLLERDNAGSTPSELAHELGRGGDLAEVLP